MEVKKEDDNTTALIKLSNADVPPVFFLASTGHQISSDLCYSMDDTEIVPDGNFFCNASIANSIRASSWNQIWW